MTEDPGPDVEEQSGHALDETQRLQILLTEMSLLQSVFNKYENWILAIRTALVAAVVGIVGYMYAQVPTARMMCATAYALLTLILAVFFYEGVLRLTKLSPYFERYRIIRATLRAGHVPQTVYDLTNHFGARQSPTEQAASMAFVTEVVAFYLALLLLAVGAILLRNLFL